MSQLFRDDELNIDDEIEGAVMATRSRKDANTGKTRRKRYTPEYKQEIVNRVVNSNRTVAQSARDFGICAQTLYSWLRDYRQDNDDSDVGRQEKEELLALREEVSRLRSNEKILAKMVIHCGQP